MWLKPKIFVAIFYQSAEADCNRIFIFSSIAVDFSQLNKILKRYPALATFSKFDLRTNMWLKPKIFIAIFYQSAKADCNRILFLLSIALKD